MILHHQFVIVFFIIGVSLNTFPFFKVFLTVFPSYRNESIDLQNKSMYLFLFDRDLRHEKVKVVISLYKYSGRISKYKFFGCMFLKVNESPRYKQCGVTPNIST